MSALSLEARSRERFLNALRAERARAHSTPSRARVAEQTLAAGARVKLRRADRIAAAVARLQNFLNRLHDDAVARKREALEQRQFGRADSIDGEIDRLYRDFDEMVKGLAEDLR
jgi:hypothetical protein